MESDIDIEEHDVLENPAIKSIFPDITALKQEIIDFCIGDTTEQMQSQEAICAPHSIDIGDDSPKPITVDRTSIETTCLQINACDKSADQFSEDTDNQPTKFRPNKIILGSKPNKCNAKKNSQHEFFKLKDLQKKEAEQLLLKSAKARVLLENVFLFLAKCDTYCDICFILFSTKIKLDNHMKLSHSVGFKENEIQSLNCTNDGFKCDKCQTNFSTKSNLTKHIKRFHLNRENVFKKILIKKIENEKKNSCCLCKKRFSTESFLSKHYKKAHLINRKNKDSSEYVNKKYSCHICYKIFSFPRNLNNHYKHIHNIDMNCGEIKTKINTLKCIMDMDYVQNDTPERRKCFHCKKTFPTQKLLIEHLYDILQTKKTDTIEPEPDSYDKLQIEKTETIKPEPGQFDKLQTKKTKRPEPKSYWGDQINENAGIDTGNIKTRDEVNEELEHKSIYKRHPKKHYRCTICSYYYNTIERCHSHLSHNHKITEKPIIEPVLFNRTCTHCFAKCKNKDIYNKHMYARHRIELFKKVHGHKKTENVPVALIPSDSDSEFTDTNTDEQELPEQIDHVNETTIEQHKLYRCFVCSYYFKTCHHYSKHLMIKHNVKDKPLNVPEKYNPTCVHCDLDYENMDRYNAHMLKCHKKEVVKRKVLTRKPKVNPTTPPDETNEPKPEITIDYRMKSDVEDNENTEVRNMFQCMICSLYFMDNHVCRTHLIHKHGITNCPKITPLSFDSTCKHCFIEYENKEVYNKHIYNCHVDEINRKVNDNDKERTPSIEVIDRDSIQQSSSKKKEPVNNKITPLSFDSTCKHCFIEYENKEVYNKHIYDCHVDEINRKVNDNDKKITPSIEVIDRDSIKQSSSKKGEPVNNIESVKNSKVANIFKCLVCSYYFKSVQNYRKHLLKNHEITDYLIIEDVDFSPTCAFCSLKYVTIKSYNAHLHRCHYKEMEKKDFTIEGSDTDMGNDMTSSKNAIKNVKTAITSPNELHTVYDKTLILKSLLFKCIKCDINFVTLKDAISHLQHMELLINWKCVACNCIFKQKDEVLHSIQHLYSNGFNVQNVSPDQQTSLYLYKCQKCAIHFQEHSYLPHHTMCGTETPKSTYCKTCDILLDDNVIKLHKQNHEIKKLKAEDFIIIDSEIISANVLKDDDLVKYARSNNVTSKVLNQSLFGNRQLARVLNYLLKLTYCSTCKCYITRNYKINVHLKGKCAHIVKVACNMCGLVLTQRAMFAHKKLHRSRKDLCLQDFEFYDLKSGRRMRPPMPAYPYCKFCDQYFISKVAVKRHLCSDEKYQLCHICDRKFSATSYKLHMGFHMYFIKYSQNNKRKINLGDDMLPNSNKPILVNEENCINEFEFIVYMCKNCKISLHNYDKVVDHCQEHYNPEYIVVETEICVICDIKFDSDSYEKHKQLHLNMKENDSFKVLKFDIFYLTMSNDAWLKHLFGSLPKEQIDSIVKNSIYFNEHRIKMKIIQNGPSKWTLYKCALCKCYMNNNTMCKHVMLDNCTSIVKRRCSYCSLAFFSNCCRSEHDEIHHQHKNINSKSFRMVLFNQKNDKLLTETIALQNRYIFYQCRNCSGIINKIDFINHVCNSADLKKCIQCGLLLNNNDYDSHIEKHNEFDSFTEEHMKVILVGQKNNQFQQIDKISSFSGMICDYFFYRCVKCYVCCRDSRDIPKHECFIDAAKAQCPECDLYFEEGKLKGHIKLHKTDKHFIKRNIVASDFDPTANKDKSKCSRDKMNVVDINKVNVTEPIIKTENDLVVNLFRCSCGLNYMTKSNATAHAKKCSVKLRYIKQSCSKCNLIFSANELFGHLVAHHGNKNVSFKYNIVYVSKNDEIKLFKCLKCSVHLLEKNDAQVHFNSCIGTNNGVSCDVCSLIFHLPCLAKHKIDHHSTPKYHYNIVNISDNEVVETKDGCS